MRNVLSSLERRPRELTIIYMDPAHEDVLLAACAKLVKASRGLRPTAQWASENSVKVYKLQARGAS